MAYASWSVVFGEQPSAAKWNILGTNDASFNDGTGIANGSIKPNHLIAAASTLNTHAWDSYTASYTNITAGNGTQASKYIQIGKTVFAYFSFILGSTSAVGTAPKFSLPVTSVSTYTANATPLGGAVLLDSGTNTMQGVGLWSTTTTCLIRYLNATGTPTVHGEITATVPFTWAVNDQLTAMIQYEAA